MAKQWSSAEGSCRLLLLLLLLLSILAAPQWSLSAAAASATLSSLSGLWVAGSMPCCRSFFLMHEFQKFLISLSVLPGSCDAIWDHLMDQAQAHDVCYVAGM
jgi:hypothetical protein